MDTNTVIEGTVKFRDGKKWKSRWCVVRKLSPVADCIHLQLYRDSKERYKQSQTKASLSLENFLGTQSGFTLDKESNTLAIVCQEVVVVLAFDTREHLIQWQVKISTNLGEGDQFLVQICSSPPRAKLAPGPAKLLIQEYQFCITVGMPPKLISFWQIRQLRRFGVVDGKFCFEGGSHCGKGEGLYVLVTEKPEELTKAFHLAAEGKLFTKKRIVTRNLSVIEKARKHHTYRPESRISNVSSLESVLESPLAGDSSRSHCCGCSRSQEDLLSAWPQSPSVGHGDTVSTSDSMRFDQSSLCSTNPGIGRCKSCMGKIGNMSQSSTMTNITCSRFPVWTMDRPKSCGSQIRSSSITCSSMSLSSHSSRGSSCGKSEHLNPCKDNCCSRCSLNGSIHRANHLPPSRPPKPSHLNILQRQSPEPLSGPSPTPTKSPSCRCSIQSPSSNSSYGNYDVPKSLAVVKQSLKLNLNETVDNVRPQSQSSCEDYYDTPRRLKDSLIWEYGNYDIPPPAQPVMSEIVSGAHELPLLRGNELDDVLSNPNDPQVNEIKNRESRCFQKVKLTGEGKMPVMSPSGILVEHIIKQEQTYEERLENLLENENVIKMSDSSPSNYENVELYDKCITEQETNVTKASCDDANQNYSNISVVQMLENYENFKCFISDQDKKQDENLPSIDKQTNDPESNGETRKEGQSLEQTSHSNHESDNVTEAQRNQSCISENELINNGTIKLSISSPHLGIKCNSTSCLCETKSDFISQEQIQQPNRTINPQDLYCSVSACSSPHLKRLTNQLLTIQAKTSKTQQVCLRQRSNSADSRNHFLDGELKFSRRLDLSILPPTTFFGKKQHFEAGIVNNSTQNETLSEFNTKLTPLVIKEFTDQLEQLSPSVSERYSDLISTKRSSSVPNKFSNYRDSSSSNDSGVSTGSLSLRPCERDFFDFEMPLTTSMSSERHNIAMKKYNRTNKYNGANSKLLQKRSKSVDPLRSITFTFESDETHCGKSTSAEAEVPIFLNDIKVKDHLNSQRQSFLSDSQSASSGTSDMSDYFETLSFSSFSSLDAASDNFRFSRSSAPTMKPRSGNEYQQIDRNLLDPNSET